MVGRKERKLRASLTGSSVVIASIQVLVGILLISAVLVGALAGGQAQAAAVAKGGTVRLGIIQIVEHPALDAARNGFLDVLKEAGYEQGKNLLVDFQNAQGDMSIAQTIARKFALDNKDLILAIATPTAQAMANADKDTPILITAVTDPVAAGLVKSLESPGTNVTGTTDMTPVRKQFELLKRIFPKAKKVGILYNAGEVNSVVQAKLAEKAAKDLGLTLVHSTASNSSEVMQATQALVGRADVIYVPTDNTFVSAFEAVANVANKYKIPIIGGEESVVDRGGIATVGINYYKLGRQTGQMALKVLQGAKPASMPIEDQDEIDLVLNLKAAKLLGVSIPDALIKEAARVIK